MYFKKKFAQIHIRNHVGVIIYKNSFYMVGHVGFYLSICGVGFRTTCITDCSV